MNKSRNWLQSLSYKQIQQLSFFVLFGWNTFPVAMCIYHFSEIFFCGVALFVCLIVLALCILRKYILLMVLGSSITSIMICCIGVYGCSYTFLVIWMMLTWAIIGLFLILCGVHALGVSDEERKTLLSRGIIVVVMATVGVFSVFA